jgi:hypothetical protein
MTKSKTHKKRIVKRSHTNKRSVKRIHTNKRRHKRSVKFFTTPIKPNLSDSIFNHDKNNSGNIIPGLRNHLRK